MPSIEPLMSAALPRMSEHTAAATETMGPYPQAAASVVGAGTNPQSTEDSRSSACFCALPVRPDNPKVLSGQGVSAAPDSPSPPERGDYRALQMRSSSPYLIAKSLEMWLL